MRGFCRHEKRSTYEGILMRLPPCAAGAPEMIPISARSCWFCQLLLDAFKPSVIGSAWIRSCNCHQVQGCCIRVSGSVTLLGALQPATVQMVRSTSYVPGMRGSCAAQTTWPELSANFPPGMLVRRGKCALGSHRPIAPPPVNRLSVYYLTHSPSMHARARQLHIACSIGVRPWFRYELNKHSFNSTQMMYLPRKTAFRKPLTVYCCTRGI